MLRKRDVIAWVRRLVVFCKCKRPAIIRALAHDLRIVVALILSSFRLEDEHMLSTKIGVAEPPYSSNRITLRQLDRLLMLHGRESRAGALPALPDTRARGVMHRCTCAHCSAPFEAATARAMYCPGGRCKQAAYRARTAAQRRSLATCAGCAERFKPVNGNQIYCCSNCRSRTWKRVRRLSERVR